MKKSVVLVSVAILFLSSCEVELVDGQRYNHHRGWEHTHYPSHHERYDHGYHHDRQGNEVIIQPRR